MRRKSTENSTQIQIQHLLKLNLLVSSYNIKLSFIQIQHLLKLNTSKINTFINYYSL